MGLTQPNFIYPVRELFGEFFSGFGRTATIIPINIGETIRLSQKNDLELLPFFSAALPISMHIRM
jgi:hypothetical protein